MRFFCFSGESLVTILSCRSRLLRATSGPTRLIRPRPIDCDRECEPPVTVLFFRFSRQLFFEHRQKKVFKRVLHLVLIYTPKEAHSRIFVTGAGQCSRDKCWQKKSSSWRGELVGRNSNCVRNHSTPVLSTQLFSVLTSDSCVLTLDALPCGFSNVHTSSILMQGGSLFNNFRCLTYSLQIHKQANRTHYSVRGESKCTHFRMWSSSSRLD